MHFPQELTKYGQPFGMLLALFFSIGVSSSIARRFPWKFQNIVFPAVLILQGMAFKIDIMLGLAAGAVAAGSIAMLHITYRYILQITRYVMSSLGWRQTCNLSYEMQMQAMLKMIELESLSAEAFSSRAENEFGYDSKAIYDVLLLPEVIFANGNLTVDASKPLERIQNQQQLTENDKSLSMPPNDMPYETQGQANLEVIERNADSSTATYESLTSLDVSIDTVPVKKEVYESLTSQEVSIGNGGSAPVKNVL